MQISLYGVSFGFSWGPIGEDVVLCNLCRGCWITEVLKMSRCFCDPEICSRQ